MRRGKVVAGVAIGVFAFTHVPAAVSAAHAAVASARQHAAVASAHVTGGSKDCAQLEQLWDAAGGNPSRAFMAAEIATAESSGQQYATLVDSNGTVDRGYWQVNSIWGPLSTYDAYGNARAAVSISHDGTDWTPWVTFDNSLYQGKC
jgi:hypothetical protein